MITIRHPASAILAVLLLAVAITLWWGSGDLSVGRAARMGPGYMPRLVAMAIAFVGVAMLARSFVMEGEPVGAVPYRALAAIVSGLLAFALLVSHAGLLIAIPVLVVLVSLGDRDLRPVPILAVAIALTIFSSVLFVYLLGLPLPLWKFGN